MNKLFKFVKIHFLTKKFITFGFIGVLNTLIHLGVYWIAFNPMDFGPILSFTIAFAVASAFSYFANAIFTFKPKNRTTMQFSVVMLVFISRWGISTGLNSGFDYIITNWLNVNYDTNSLLSLIAPFFASALLIPISYFALDYVFKKTDNKKPLN